MTSVCLLGAHSQQMQQSRPNYFYRGYALHGSTSVPTSAASHGCVRLTIPAMNRVWSQLVIGERVYVYR
jgi:lipoprotein-anchoring transpeptidase ErfK/SrfK